MLILFSDDPFAPLAGKPAGGRLVRGWGLLWRGPSRRARAAPRETVRAEFFVTEPKAPAELAAQTQRALEESEDRYRDLVEHIHDLVGTHDLSGRILSINRAGREAAGIDEETLLKGNLRDFLAPEMRDRFQDYLAAIRRVGRATGLMIVVAGSGERRVWEYDNTLRTDGVGEPIVRSMARDVTAKRQVEGALRESEARYRRFFEADLSGAFVSTPEGKILDCNPAFARLLGFESVEAALSADAASLYPASGERERFLSHLRRERALQSVEAELIRRDGARITVLSNVIGVFDGQDRLVRFFGFLFDITERKRAEGELARTVREWQSTFDAANDAICVLGADQRVLRSNRTAEQLFDRPAADIAGRYYWEIALGTAQPIPGCPVQRARTSLRRETMELQIGERWFEVTADPMVNEAGEFSGAVHTVSDVTERRRAEQTLHTSEERLRVGLNAANIAVFDQDMDLRYVWMYQPQLGYGSEEVVGHTDADLLPLEAARHVMEIKRRVLESGQRERAEIPVSVGGQTFVYDLVAEPLRDASGAIVGLTGASLDITERKAAEEEKETLRAQLAQARKMESVGRLAGGVAHDFNNALTVIMGHAALALEQVGQEGPLHGHLEEIQKAGQRSADLTGQLLAFARKQAVAPAVQDLNRTLEGLLRMLRRLIGEEIVLTWMPGTGIRLVEIDPSQVSQLLTNLCVNARDAIAGVGKVTIETSNVTFDEAACSSRPGSSPGDYVRLAVSDDGAGMGKDVLEHVFEPFFTTKALGRGTGLGLATVYGIVKQNQGYINVTSEPGEGSTFEIFLRASSKDAVQAEAGRAGGAEEAPRGCGETVLLVEDEAPVLRLGETMLEQLGYTVLCAGTPGEAMRKAQSHPGAIELLVTDVVMPEMNGKDLAERVRAARPKIRCLFVSGYTADIIAHRGVLDEGIRFLQKPFSVRDLAFKVRDALDDGERAATDVGAKGQRVLYVDDDPQLVELARWTLGKLGHDVTGYTDPAAALDEFQRRPGEFDAVVTDLAMPGLSGLELTRRLLAARADVPVVVTSGYVSEENETAARAAGARAVLQKASTVEEMGVLLDRVLRAFEGSGNR